MWSLELYLENTSISPDGEAYSFWHMRESIEPYSEKNQWETIAEWKEKYNLQFFKGHYYICLSRISIGFNNFQL